MERSVALTIPAVTLNISVLPMGFADGQDPLAHPNLVGVPQGRRRQIRLVDPQDRDVAQGVLADDLGFVLTTVEETDENATCAIDDVIIGGRCSR